MATYKEIKGVTVQTLDSDPVIAGVAGGSWSTGGTTGTTAQARFGFGTLTAGVACGGNTGPGTMTGNTEKYDGTSWTESGDLNLSRNNEASGGGGTQTAGIVASGNTPGVTGDTETFNGSVWSEISDMGSTRSSLSSDGTSTAFIGAGGTAPGGTR